MAAIVNVAVQLPYGWATGPNGEAVSPQGQVYPPGTSFDPNGNPIAPGATSGSLPVLSIAGGAIAGKLFGKTTTWMIAGAFLGLWLRPLES